MLDDPEYKKTVDTVFAGYEVLTDEPLDAVVNEVVSPPQEALDWIFEYLLSEFNVDVHD